MNYYKRNIYLLYSITFFDALILAYVIERLFWSERGMSVKMVVATEIIYAITILIFEVPTGILADSLGRKKILLVSAFLSVLELVIIYNAHNFMAFVIAIVIAGISHAANSGSYQAILYDSLQCHKKEEYFEKYYARLNILDTLGSCIAATLGGCIAYYFSYESNYILSILSKMTALILTFFVTEPPRKKIAYETKNLEYYTNYIKEGLAFFKYYKIIVTYCIEGMFLAACLNYLDEFWQLLMKEIGTKELFYGIIFVGFYIFSIPGNLIVTYVKKRVGYSVFFIVVPFIYAFCFFLIAVIHNMWVLAPMGVLGIIKGIMEPMVEGCIHHNTKSDVRATVESFISLAMRVLAIVVGLVFSLYADQNIFVGFLALGIMCFVYAMINILIYRKTQG